ncbi:hypothetical protein BSZ21_02880 [Bradyrhizobium canariense]|nr:hypothetical protein BSZ21_02880 [Bradyrhizobium canariense]
MILAINSGLLDRSASVGALLADRGNLIALGACSSWRRTGGMIRGCCASSRSTACPGVKDYIATKDGRFIVQMW